MRFRSAVILLVPTAWWSVTRGLGKLDDGAAALASVREATAGLGRMTVPERRIAMVFGAVAILWVTRLWTVDLAASLGWAVLDGYSGAQVDMMIAILGAIVAFLVPAGGGENRALLTWEEAVKLPWGVLLLFGGGIALGNAVKDTGLSV